MYRFLTYNPWEAIRVKKSSESTVVSSCCSDSLSNSFCDIIIHVNHRSQIFKLLDTFKYWNQLYQIKISIHIVYMIFYTILKLQFLSECSSKNILNKPWTNKLMAGFLLFQLSSSCSLDVHTSYAYLVCTQSYLRVRLFLSGQHLKFRHFCFNFRWNRNSWCCFVFRAPT